jgi:hypothetical protein
MKARTYHELPIHRVASMAGLALILAVCGPDWGTEPGLLSGRLSRTERRTLEAGTLVEVRFDESLSSDGSLPGEVFRARVERDIVAGEEIVVPRGATVVGSVVEARSGSDRGAAVRLSLDFHLLELPGGEVVPLAATLVRGGEAEPGDEAKRRPVHSGASTDGDEQVVIRAQTIVTLELAEAADVPLRVGRGSDRPKRSSR